VLPGVQSLGPSSSDVSICNDASHFDVPADQGRRAAVCRALAVVNAYLVAALLSVSTGVALADEVEEEITFPYLLKMAPGNVLVVHGHDFTGEVWLTYTPGDSLRVEGLPIYPLPPDPPRVFSEMQLAKAYGKVDYVQDLVDSGYTWHQATDAYNQKVNAAIGAMLDLYESVLDSTGDTKQAETAVVDSFDRSLLEPGTEPFVSSSSIIVKWQGSMTEHISLKHIRERGREPRSFPWAKAKTEEDIAEVKARTLIHWLDGTMGDNLFVLKSPRGTCIFGGDDARRAMAQIEEAKRGNVMEGLVDETELRRVIGVQGSDQR